MYSIGRKRSIRFAVAIVAAALAGGAESAAETAWRFDCGTAKSPVMEGYKPLTGEDMYDASKGYGWEGTAPGSVVFGYAGSEEDRARAAANSGRGGGRGGRVRVQGR